MSLSNSTDPILHSSSSPFTIIQKDDLSIDWLLVENTAPPRLITSPTIPQISEEKKRKVVCIRNSPLAPVSSSQPTLSKRDHCPNDNHLSSTEEESDPKGVKKLLKNSSNSDSIFNKTFNCFNTGSSSQQYCCLNWKKWICCYGITLCSGLYLMNTLSQER
jgi:hypothetical protein